MRVLVVGGGGREHALVWKIRQSPRVKEVFCLPGNAGIARLARCVPGNPEDVRAVADFARAERIDLTVVGPEAPLVAGLTDELARYGLPVFGPSRAAAELEGSKAFAKELMARHGIPTAEYHAFDDPRAAADHIRRLDRPVVVKADGLAAGKGVVVADTPEEALAAVREIMVQGVHGAAGRRVVVEERLQGEEVSVLALTDGERVIPLVSAQDHKRAYDGDRGPNTGGMGAYSPAPIYTPEMARRVEAEILLPTVRGMAGEGRPYLGVLYAGLMLTADGPKVLEYNCRFGDPETQAVLPRLASDLVDALEAAAGGDLRGQDLHWRPEAAVCVVLASGGYPGPYEKGKSITGLEQAESLPDVLVFHAGTAAADGGVLTAGGRVLNVTALGDTIAAASARAYQAVDHIGFPGCHFRRDIAARALDENRASSSL